MDPVRAGIALVILLALAITAIAYPALPETVPSHWNAAGEVDGYLPLPWGVAIIPLAMVLVTALLLLLPRIDPLRENYRAFRPYYDGFVLLFAAYLLVLQAWTLSWALGFPVSPNLLFPLLFGTLYIYTGFLLERAAPNWFVGIRTPWTLSSEAVWKKTHTRGGKLFKLAGVVALAGALAGAYALWFVLAPALAVSAYLAVYSYIEYRQERETA